MAKPETIKIDVMKRFENFIIPITESGCWIWTGGSDKRGYGKFWMGDRYESSHRASYLLHKGLIPDDKLILHKCDIPACVNPEHLYCGTYSENTRDAIKRNRYNRFSRVRGENHGRAVLTEIQVIEILKSKERTADLSRKYNVNFMTISCIRKNKSWKHLGRN